MKDYPKFDPLLHQSSKPSDTENEEDNGEDGRAANREERKELKRRTGRKRMKKQLGKAELTSKCMKVAEATLETQRKRNQLLFFTEKVDNLDPVVNEYIQIRRRQVLKRFKASETQTSSLQTPDSSPSPNPQ